MRDYGNYDCVENTAAASYFVRFLLKPPYLFALSEQKIRFQVGLLKKVSSPTCGHFLFLSSLPLSCFILLLYLSTIISTSQLVVLFKVLRTVPLLHANAISVKYHFVFLWGTNEVYFWPLYVFWSSFWFFSGRNKENDTFYKWMRVSLWMESKIMEQIKSWAVWVLLTFPYLMPVVRFFISDFFTSFFPVMRKCGPGWWCRFLLNFLGSEMR